MFPKWKSTVEGGGGEDSSEKRNITQFNKEKIICWG